MAKAIVAIDDLESAEALARAAQACLRDDYDYVVVAVAPSSTTPFLAPSTQEDVEDERAEAWKRPAALAAALLGSQAEPVVVHGEPGRQIVELASDGDADVIVVGREAPSVVRRALGKSVSEYVLDHARSAVLVLPSPHD